MVRSADGDVFDVGMIRSAGPGTATPWSLPSAVVRVFGEAISVPSERWVTHGYRVGQTHPDRALFRYMEHSVVMSKVKLHSPSIGSNPVRT